MKRIPAEGIEGVAHLREAASTELKQILDLVRAALRDWYDARKKPDETYVDFDFEAMYPERAIVCKDGRYWQFPYVLDDKNQVTLGAPSEVIEEFKPVAMREAADMESLREASDPQGNAWDVVVVRAGKSGNGNYYPDAVLREAAPMFDGINVYAKSNVEHLKGGEPDVNQLFGWLSEARFVEGAAADAGHIAARLDVAAGAQGLRDTIAGAWRLGKKNLVGLSIDVRAKTARSTARLREGVKRVAAGIIKVNSVDLIVNPSAGGALVRLVESAEREEHSEMALKEKMQARIKAKFPLLDVEALNDDQLEARYAEALAPEKETPAAGEEPVTRDELRMIEARANARVKISGSPLPAAAKEKLHKAFDLRERFVEADVDTAITEERAYLARFTESGRVQMAGLDVEVRDRSQTIADMLDAFFDPKHKEHGKIHSFKECYAEITGDRSVTGRIENMDRSRLAESLGAAFRESLETTSLANVLGDSIARRMIADYRDMGQWDVWRNACERVPLNDFRTNERTRFGGYGDLPVVAQGAAYVALASPTDEKATYAPAKRGGTEDLTRELIKNDDVGAIRRIPIQLSRSAKRTLCKFVMDFVRTNPTLYDSVAFFHATHANLGSAALDATTLAAARLRMKKQAELNSAARISIGPKFLWVPDDLEEAAVNLFNKNTNLDKTFVQALSLAVMPVPYWTDANDWSISADPMDIPGIEIGFVDGAEEPALFVQDMPNVGSMFSNDKLTYKIRHEYGGQVKEYRGWDKSVVA